MTKHLSLSTLQLVVVGIAESRRAVPPSLLQTELFEHEVAVAMPDRCVCWISRAASLGSGLHGLLRTLFNTTTHEMNAS